MLRKSGLLLLCVLISACTSTSTPPSPAEAKGLLDRIVSLAQHGDFAGLCNLGDGNCWTNLEAAGRDAVPSLSPRVVATWVMSGSSTGLGAGTVAGRVLVICGTDGRGRPYRSEMLVFRDGSGLRAINPIFWDNMAIAAGTVNPPTATPVPGCGEST